MSAYVVDRITIDLILTGMIALEPNHQWIDPAAYSDPNWERAFQAGSWWGPDAARISQTYTHTLKPDTADEVGLMLWAENARSVAFRYNEPEFDVSHYAYQSLAGTPIAGHVVGALRCLNYQSCEHPAYQHSEAHAFTIGALACLARRLKGADEVWDVTDRNIWRTR